MRMAVMPVANGVLARTQGGRITGMFLLEFGGQLLIDVGVGKEMLICPWIVDLQILYPVGVMVRIVDIWEQAVVNENGEENMVLLATLEGRGHVRWHTVTANGNYLWSNDVEMINLKAMRKEYPSISGAGWTAEGGYTEFRASDDIPVTIYGHDLETGKEVCIKANLGGLVTQEQAHTLEHSIIRSLNTYGLCTAKTLVEAMKMETNELKRSVEFSIRYTLPEALGITASGVCGNPMTNLAQMYLTRELISGVRSGQNVMKSLEHARRATMSQLTEDMGLTMKKGLRVLQGLKKGMAHDDTLLKIETYKRVIQRFPFEPWN
ncbi:MAG TPA: hypothetical protein VN611_13285 [Patescibacteria group bacterium]|nr:hypothetical protein [Patescibacteria group bacterium]